MELFFSREFDGSICRLDADESAHCVKVLRHREGDTVNVIDGEGTLYSCRLIDASPKGAVAEVVSVQPDWGAHPYRLNMAVCPTKNADRYEWFAEKATELGVDVITPVIGEHSERRVFKTDRLKRILLSASKQSLKGAVPEVAEPLPLKDFIPSCSSDAIKLICCCYEGEERRISIREGLCRPGECPAPQDPSHLTVGPSLLRCRGWHDSQDGTDLPVSALPPQSVPDSRGWHGSQGGKDLPEMSQPSSIPEIVVLIGPEGDFSREEVALAVECGFKPVHLGPSRLRTETAALAAVAAVYYHFCGETAME